MEEILRLYKLSTLLKATDCNTSVHFDYMQVACDIEEVLNRLDKAIRYCKEHEDILLWDGSVIKGFEKLELLDILNGDSNE